MENISDAMKFLDPAFRESLGLLDHVVTDIVEIKRERLDRKLIRKQQDTLRKVKEMMEVNPMLGHRGVRLGITYPEIYQMQIQAILEAAAELLKEGVQVQPEIMVPQVCTAQELKWVHQLVAKIQREVEKQYGIEIPFKFGTMIEVVRACMRAGRLAEVADFFSFGTNDLTQATFSFSREDAENKFLPLYNQRKILQDNPFAFIIFISPDNVFVGDLFPGLFTDPGITDAAAITAAQEVKHQLLALTCIKHTNWNIYEAKTDGPGPN